MTNFFNPFFNPQNVDSRRLQRSVTAYIGQRTRSIVYPELVAIDVYINNHAEHTFAELIRLGTRLPTELYYGVITEEIKRRSYLCLLEPYEARVIMLLTDGHNQGEIARAMGIPVSEVWRLKYSAVRKIDADNYG